jgi:type I restriction enzyme S subunit
MIARLGDISEFINGGSWSDKEYTENGIPVVKVTNLKNGSVDLSEINYIPESSLDKYGRHMLRKGDLVIATVGSHPNLVASAAGRATIIPSKAEGALLNQNALCIRTNSNDLNQGYLGYLGKSDLFQGYVKSIGRGAANQVRIALGLIKEFSFELPPLPTQRKIASILSTYDYLIENNMKRIKLLEEKAFLRYKGIVRSEKMEEFTIEELADVAMGQSPASDTYTVEIEDNLPFHQGVTNFTNFFVENKTYCKAPIKIAQIGDILFSVRAPVGRINFTNEKICIGRGLCAFRSKKGFQNYFYHQLKEFFFKEDVIGNGAIFNAVTKVELMKVRLRTPSEKAQREFESEAEQIYNLILNLSKQNTKLREARDILLPKLMNGQITV